MMARIWRGQTRPQDALAYLEVLKVTGVADYQATPGNRGVWILTRDLVDEVEFTVLTLWDSRQSIARFAGEDIDVARYYPEDSRYLLRFAQGVEHFECPVHGATSGRTRSNCCPDESVMPWTAAYGQEVQ